MNPYIKKIVELHKIHKAIENNKEEGGDVTPTPSPTPSAIIGFPYQPKNVLGWVPLFIDDDYNRGYTINDTDGVVNILIEPILPENLEEYVNNRISESTEEDIEIFFSPVFEYDETMDICARSYSDYTQNPPEFYGGIPITINHKKSKNSTQIYSNVQPENWKGIYNGQEYIIAIAQSG